MMNLPGLKVVFGISTCTTSTETSTSPKLEGRVTQKSQVYLAIHSASMLTIDTKKISWKQLVTEQSLD